MRTTILEEDHQETGENRERFISAIAGEDVSNSRCTRLLVVTRDLAFTRKGIEKLGNTVLLKAGRCCQCAGEGVQSLETCIQEVS